MHDPLFDTTSDTTSDRTSSAAGETGGPATGQARTQATSPATSPAVNSTGSTGTSVGASTPTSDARSSSRPAMPPPTGLPLSPGAYRWPAPIGAPVGTPIGPPAGAPLAPVPAPAVAGQRSDTYKGLAIASFVLSVVAVVGVLLFGLGAIQRPAPAASVADSASADPGSGPDNMPVGPLTGSVSVAAGTSLPGEDLANAIEQRIHDDGANEVSMDCPNTRKVAQGVVTVCHGQIEGEDWAVVVYFEDNLGSFTLNPL